MPQANLPLAIALMGPTASGKTDLAIALTEILDAEIISVDSAMVYRGMDIGTAKPGADELARAPHRLIDIRDPSQPYSVADFCVDAKREMEKICSEGKTPLLVGGTMLYFKALLQGLADLPPADEQIRAKIEADAKTHGWRYIHDELKKVDPLAAERIHPNHSQRLSRALEVYLLSGVSMTELHARGAAGLLNRYRWVQIAIAPRNRETLHQRITIRFAKMLDAGLIEEVRQLFVRGDLHPDLPAIRSVGYRQVWDYIAGSISYDELCDKGVAATRQLAKRQLTWLRTWPATLNWLYTQHESGENLAPKEIIDEALSFLGKRPI